MVSAADLIQALQRRLRLVAPHTRREPGQFPPGWQAWLDAQGRLPGKTTGAPAESLVSVLAQRPLMAPPQRIQGLSGWQAFATLWRQHWRPPPREERKWRWFAAAVSVVSHLMFAVLLVWLTLVQFSLAPPREGEDVVQVELIGTGTPEEAGGGAPDGPDTIEPTETAEPVPSVDPPPAPEPEPAAVPETPVEPAPEPSPEPSPPIEVDAPAVPQPVVPPAQVADLAEVEPVPVPIEQPLEVSEPVPDSSDEFVLTAPVPRVSLPEAPVPELRAPASTVQVIDIPAPLPSARPTLREPGIAAPALSQRTPQVTVREIPTPVRAPAVTTPEPVVAAPQLQSRIPEVRTATIPSPPTPQAAAPTMPPAAETEMSGARESRPSAEAPAGATPSMDGPGTPSPPGGRTPEAATAGAGPEAAPAPGGWTTPARSDDWGDATRNRPGGQRGDDGLYDSDGRVRLAETPGSAPPGEPPGSVTEEIVNLDRAGTWLRRPPIDYEPTAFDRYWRPNESLLEEWVRRSITTVRIPIPGTNKYIVCQTVLLALGGGCGITDPNLNEQAATARPPPDIPFKPELQEDNGSIRPSSQSDWPPASEAGNDPR